MRDGKQRALLAFGFAVLSLELMVICLHLGNIYTLLKGFC